jgi:hypothetical protein
MAKVQVVEHRIVVNKAVVAAELDDEAVLLNVETGVYFGLDAVGHRIWESLEAGRGETEITELLLADYDVEPERLAADIAEFLELLSRKGLIRYQED